LTGVLPASPARKGGVKGSYTKMSFFLSGKPRPEGREGFTCWHLGESWRHPIFLLSSEKFIIKITLSYTGSVFEGTFLPLVERLSFSAEALAF